MRIVALDLASTTGYAVLERDDAGKISLLAMGAIHREDRDLTDGYPFSYVNTTYHQSVAINTVIYGNRPDVVVVEETNQTKGSRYAQKYLEFLHLQVLQRNREEFVGGLMPPIEYVSTGEWKHTLGIKLSKDQKKANRKLKEIKTAAGGDAAALRQAKKAAGLKGKVTGKHLSVAYVNQRFGLSLKQGDNDVADAICLGEAYLKGAKVCDGT